MPIPPFDGDGDLPPGIHAATMDEVAQRFEANPRRSAITATLLHLHTLARLTGKLSRFILFGSYVTAKPSPNDVDIFLVMSQDFNVEEYTGATRTLFSHGQAEHELGASVFWAYEGIAPSLIEDLLEGWQTTRDRKLRGIVEVIG